MGQVTPLLMPQAGNSMEEGTILHWRVREGERVAAGQIVCEIETDKATVEVEAPEAGRLARIAAAKGTVVPVKQPIAYFAEVDADVDAFIQTQRGAAAAPHEIISDHITPAPVHAGVHESRARIENGRRRASPAARKLARERGIDLVELPPGSGPEGRLLSIDVPATLPASAATMPFYARITIDADPLLRCARQTGDGIESLLVSIVARLEQEFPQLHAAHGLAVHQIAMEGIDEFAAPLPPGQPAIIAFACIREAVTAQHGVMRAGRVMTVTLTADARHIASERAVEIMARLRQLLEAPEKA